MKRRKCLSKGKEKIQGNSFRIVDVRDDYCLDGKAVEMVAAEVLVMVMVRKFTDSCIRVFW